MSSLINKNIMVAGHRTSMRLEPEMWDALAEICQREKSSIRDICTIIDASRGSSSLTSAVRVFILAYYRFVVANTNNPAFASASEKINIIVGRIFTPAQQNPTAAASS